MMFTYAQNFEDVYIHRAFSDVAKGFYIDAGAFHPDFESVTRLFYDLGWNGINIEPGPTFSTFTKRERDLNLQVALAGKTGEIQFFHHEDAPWTSTIVADLHPELADKVKRRRKSEIQSLSLPDLIDRHAAGEHVHFLKIDIEGGEKVVIDGADWTRHRPELLIIESTRPYTNIRNDTWGTDLAAANYVEVFFDGINVYYLREESLFRRHAFNRPINVLDGFTKYDPAIERLKEKASKLDEYAGKIARYRSRVQELEEYIKNMK